MNKKINNQIKDKLSDTTHNWIFSKNTKDTFDTLYKISKEDNSLINKGIMGKVIKLLTNLEVKEGGPYANGDIKTNTSIARFLATQDIYLPNMLPFYPKNKKEKDRQKENTEILFTKEEKPTIDQIFILFEDTIKELPDYFQKLATKVFQNTIKDNKDKQMSLVGFYLEKSLGKKLQKNIASKIGMINIFFWSAFIIYDDFWDEDEKAKPELLPIANFFSRIYTDFFTSALNQNDSFKKFFHKLMNRLDGANLWELQNCRAKIENNFFEIPEVLPDYQDYEHKYEPSSGHILGPVLILCTMNKDTEHGEDANTGHQTYTKENNSAEHNNYKNDIENIILFFKYLLISMQINDDMHDFEEDLKRGHISTAVELFLRKKQKIFPKKINLITDLPKVREYFWFDIMPKLAEKSIKYAEKAIESIHNTSIIKNPKYLLALPERCKKISEDALKERDSSVDFIKSYFGV
ncbi:MAG: hypothetical protein K9L98_01685 [Candidatus Pacebacteria bacterium]|nr:hypothetical protein [Candidatus Paceibacterota bacterium]MCF7862699.1 hypothetical protein [Candidatus Paceibacterota bacterium]